MKVTGEIKIKEVISVDDIRRVIESIVNSYFVNGEYTPYYAEIAKTMAIAVNFVEGVTFDKKDDIYALCKTDEKLFNIIKVLENDHYKSTMEFVDKCVADKVDFMKQSIIHSHRDMDKIIEFFDVIIDSFENFSKLDLKNISNSDIELVRSIMNEIQDKGISVESIAEAVKNAVAFDMDKASAEIIDDLKSQLKEKDKLIQELTEISSKRKGNK